MPRGGTFTAPYMLPLGAMTTPSPAFTSWPAFTSIETTSPGMGDTISFDVSAFCFGGIFSWPGPIHEGRGQVLPIVDERATPDQRQAVLAIMTGAETEPGATIFNVFAATFEKVHEPVFRRIDFSFDLARREERGEVRHRRGLQAVFGEVGGHGVRRQHLALPRQVIFSVLEEFRRRGVERGR